MTYDVYDLIRGIKISKVPMRQIYEEGIIHVNNELPVEVNEKKVRRAMVNNIRHSHTNYQYGLKKLGKLSRTHKCKRHIVYDVYKNAILNTISEEYPNLKDECDIQMRKIKMVTNKKKDE